MVTQLGHKDVGLVLQFWSNVFMIFFFFVSGCWYQQEKCQNYWYLCRLSQTQLVHGIIAAECSKTQGIQEQIDCFPKKRGTAKEGRCYCELYIILLKMQLLRFSAYNKYLIERTNSSISPMNLSSKVRSRKLLGKVNIFRYHLILRLIRFCNNFWCF